MYESWVLCYSVYQGSDHVCCAIFNRAETSVQTFVQTDTYWSREPVNLQGYIALTQMALSIQI